MEKDTKERSKRGEKKTRNAKSSLPLSPLAPDTALRLLRHLDAPAEALHTGLSVPPPCFFSKDRSTVQPASITPSSVEGRAHKQTKQPAPLLFFNTEMRTHTADVAPSSVSTQKPEPPSSFPQQLRASSFLQSQITASKNSYDRIQPNTWSGAYHIWGKENREAPLRTACPPGVPREVVSNFEIKSFDGSANPHLGLASIVAAGIDGLRRSLRLPKPVDVNPSNLDSELQRLPKGLHESIQELAEDSVLKDLLGEKLVTAVIGVRKAEIDYYGKNKEVYKQLIHRY